MKVQEIIDYYVSHGFNIDHYFEGEYTLLTNFKYGTIRVYDTGVVLESDPLTGEYIRVQ